jgi:hypothetical protein
MCELYEAVLQVIALHPYAQSRRRCAEFEVDGWAWLPQATRPIHPLQIPCEPRSGIALAKFLMPGTFAKCCFKPLTAHCGIDLTIYHQGTVWL